ncbi:hypothetical protein IWQ62_004399, partial [Dispira parvispora]
AEEKSQGKLHDSLLSQSDSECASEELSNKDMDPLVVHHPASDGEEPRGITEVRVTQAVV